MATAILQKVESKTLRGLIAQQLREAILNGSLREGERLIERKLADQCGASLTAVREALIELETEGFVHKQPNAATHVIKLSLPEIKKIFAIRRVLEAYAVTEAARCCSEEQKLALEGIYFDLVQSARLKDAKLYVQKDYALHKAIWAVSGNEYLEAHLQRLVLPYFAFCAIRTVARSSIDMMQDAALHLPIVQSIGQRDPDTAQKAFFQALGQWWTSTTDVLDDQLKVAMASTPGAVLPAP